MKLAQVRVTEASTGIEILQWRLIDPARVFQSDAMGRVEFLLQKIHSPPARRDKQIAVDAIKIAVDFLLARDLFDLVDGGAMTLGREPQAFGTMKAFAFAQSFRLLNGSTKIPSTVPAQAPTSARTQIE